MKPRFSRKRIADQRYESAAFVDVNGNGQLDIVSGSFWYEGPDFTKRHILAPQEVHDEEYFDDFSTIPMDISGSGLADIITGGWFGQRLRWLENPGEAGKQWLTHELDPIGNIETTRAWDIDGDG